MIADTIFPIGCPVKDTGAPEWFVKDGPGLLKHTEKTEVKIEADIERRSLKIYSAAAELAISPRKIAKATWRWVVRWHIKHSAHEEVTGTVLWADDDLRDAFALADPAATLKPPLYIRWYGYLNVPCVGEGLAGDPNLCIEITGGMQEAVKAILRMP